MNIIFLFMLLAKFDAIMPARVVIQLTWQLVLLFITFLAASASPWNQNRIFPSDLQALQDLYPYFCNSCLEELRMNPSSSLTWSLNVDPCGSDRKWFGVVCMEVRDLWSPYTAQQTAFLNAIEIEASAHNCKNCGNSTNSTKTLCLPFLD